MRISDDRYNRDLRRHTLAMRLIQHQARTETITRWTGLSAFRVRALFHSYANPSIPSATIRRRRGAAPRKLDVFFKSPRHELETVSLAICCHLEGVLPKQPIPNANQSFPSLDAGEKICTAFEAFRFAVAEPIITIEHAILLNLALARGDELFLDSCTACGGLIIANRLAPPKPLCFYCREDRAAD